MWGWQHSSTRDCFSTSDCDLHPRTELWAPCSELLMAGCCCGVYAQLKDLWVVFYFAPKLGVHLMGLCCCFLQLLSCCGSVIERGTRFCFRAASEVEMGACAPEMLLVLPSASRGCTMVRSGFAL